MYHRPLLQYPNQKLILNLGKLILKRINSLSIKTPRGIFSFLWGRAVTIGECQDDFINIASAEIVHLRDWITGLVHWSQITPQNWLAINATDEAVWCSEARNFNRKLYGTEMTPACIYPMNQKDTGEIKILFLVQFSTTHRFRKSEIPKYLRKPQGDLTNAYA